MWGALSEERTGLSFTSASGLRQRSHSRGRGPCDSQPYVTVSDSRPTFSSPRTTRRVTVEVFDPASKRESLSLILRPTLSRPVFLGIKHPTGAYDQIFGYCRTFVGLLMRGVLSDERTGLSFTIATVPRQRSHSRLQVRLDS
jgi:hypothetical protein